MTRYCFNAISRWKHKWPY